VDESEDAHESEVGGRERGGRTRARSVDDSEMTARSKRDCETCSFRTGNMPG
jgi:hypothetical protein